MESNLHIARSENFQLIFLPQINILHTNIFERTHRKGIGKIRDGPPSIWFVLCSRIHKYRDSLKIQQSLSLQVTVPELLISWSFQWFSGLLIRTTQIRVKLSVIRALQIFTFKKESHALWSLLLDYRHCLQKVGGTLCVPYFCYFSYFADNQWANYRRCNKSTRDCFATTQSTSIIN